MTPPASQVWSRENYTAPAKGTDKGDTKQMKRLMNALAQMTVPHKKQEGRIPQDLCRMLLATDHAALSTRN